MSHLGLGVLQSRHISMRQTYGQTDIQGKIKVSAPVCPWGLPCTISAAMQFNQLEMAEGQGQISGDCFAVLGTEYRGSGTCSPRNFDMITPFGRILQWN